MKKIYFFTFIGFLFLSCQPKYTATDYTSTRFHDKVIAIAPFDIHTTVEELPDGITNSMIEEAEKRKSLFMQRDMYRYLLRELAKSSRRVVLQNPNETNKRLKKAGLTDEMIFRVPKKRLARLAGVDAILYGNVYQTKQKFDVNNEEPFRMGGMNNKISTVIYVYDKKRGRIQWKYDRSQSGFPSNIASDIVKGLLRKAARNFPF